MISGVEPMIVLAPIEPGALIYPFRKVARAASKAVARRTRIGDVVAGGTRCGHSDRARHRQAGAPQAAERGCLHPRRVEAPILPRLSSVSYSLRA